MADAQTSPRSMYLKQLSWGQNGTVRMLMGVHVGATWRIQLNLLCVAVILPYVQLL